MNTTHTTDVTATTDPLGLKNVLLLDSAVTGANGLAYLVGAAFLDSLLGPSTTVLLVIGGFLTIYAIELAVVGTRDPISRRLAGLFAEANLLWVAGSVAAVAFGWLDLTTTGAVWVIVQAVVVAAFAALQLSALRRP